MATAISCRHLFSRMRRRPAGGHGAVLANVGMAALGGAAAGGFMGGISQGVGYARGKLTMGTAEDMARQVAEIRAAEEGKTAEVQKTASTGEAGEYRAVKPENVKFPTVPLIDLSTQDIPGVKGVLPQTGNVLRADAITRARERLGLNRASAAYIPASNVVRDGHEYVLKVTPTSLKKMLNPAGGADLPVQSIVVMDNLERIANNGVWFDSEGDRKGRVQVQGFDHLKTSVYIDGVPYEVDMRVRLVEARPGSGADNVLYYFTPEELISIRKVDPRAPAGRRATSVLAELESTSDTIIPTSGDGVKGQSALTEEDWQSLMDSETWQTARKGEAKLDPDMVLRAYSAPQAVR